MSRARTNRRRAERARRCYWCHETSPWARLRIWQAKCCCVSCYMVHSSEPGDE